MCANSEGSAIGTVQIENGRTRVTEWRFPKMGDDTGWHRHEFDYVVVPLFDGSLRIQMADGEVVTAQLKNGVPYFRELGVKHNVISDNDFECAFIEVEFLERPRV
jgi:hypothetical protein